MALTIYQAFVPTAQQMLGSMQEILKKTQAWCTETGMADEALVNLRLHETMLPLSFQIRSVGVHSIGAVDAVRSGIFDVMAGETAETLSGMLGIVERASADLAKVTEDELEAAASRTVTVKLPGTDIPFAAADFLLSFSQPNFFFHLTTAYDILREAGVELGKRDFLGQMRIKA